MAVRDAVRFSLRDSGVTAHDTAVATDDDCGRKCTACGADVVASAAGSLAISCTDHRSKQLRWHCANVGTKSYAGSGDSDWGKHAKGTITPKAEPCLQCLQYRKSVGIDDGDDYILCHHCSTLDGTGDGVDV